MNAISGGRGPKQKCLANLERCWDRALRLRSRRPSGLVQDLYTASKDNRAFLHARLGLGHNQLQPFKANISTSICPDVMNTNAYRFQKPRRRLRTTRKRLVARMGWRSCRYFIAKRRSAF